MSVILITDPGRPAAVIDFVATGNFAQLDDAAFVADWIRCKLGAALATGDGLSSGAGNPAVPTWLRRRPFGWLLGKDRENRRYVRQIAPSSGLAVVIGDAADHSVKVGRSFQRFALQATALRIRHAHIKQPVQVPPICTEFAPARHRWRRPRPRRAPRLRPSPADVAAPPGRSRAVVT